MNIYKSSTDELSKIMTDFKAGADEIVNIIQQTTTSGNVGGQSINVTSNSPTSILPVLVATAAAAGAPGFAGLSGNVGGISYGSGLGSPSVVPYSGNTSGISIANGGAYDSAPGVVPYTGNLDNIQIQGGSTPYYGTGVAGSINQALGISTTNNMWVGKGSLAKYANIAGNAYGFYSAVTGGGGFGNALSAAYTGAELGSAFGPEGTAIGAGVGFFAGLIGIGNHDKPQNMPDKYDTYRFTTEVGELQGHMGTAYGPPFNPANDAVIQELGGLSILAYIENWIAANLHSGSDTKKKLAGQLISKYGTTGGGLLNFGHDIGDESVKGGSLSGKYTDIYTTAISDLQQIMTIDNDTATPNELVALNQYGGTSGFMPFSWNTPGYNFPATPVNSAPVVTTPTTTPSAPSPSPGKGGGMPSGGGGGVVPIRGSGPGVGSGKNNSMFSYAYNVPTSGGATPTIVINQTHTLPLDGRVLSKVNQSYTLRANAAGFRRIV